MAMTRTRRPSPVTDCAIGDWQCATTNAAKSIPMPTTMIKTMMSDCERRPRCDRWHSCRRHYQVTKLLLKLIMLAKQNLIPRWLLPLLNAPLSLTDSQSSSQSPLTLVWQPHSTEAAVQQQPPQATAEIEESEQAQQYEHAHTRADEEQRNAHSHSQRSAERRARISTIAMRRRRRQWPAMMMHPKR